MSLIKSGGITEDRIKTLMEDDEIIEKYTFSQIRTRIQYERQQV